MRCPLRPEGYRRIRPLPGVQKLARPFCIFMHAGPDDAPVWSIDPGELDVFLPVHLNQTESRMGDSDHVSDRR